MTALDRYTTLEGAGLWRADAQAQRRDVAVRLGKSTLTILDAKNGAALAHWALPAVQRMNPGHMPALFHPGAGADDESLETSDPLLVEGLETILAALHPRPRGHWLRWGVLGAGLALIAFGAQWLPDALVQRTATIVPQAMRNQIGREALDSLTRPGAVARLCTQPTGRQALTSLRNRVLGPNWRVQVIAGPPGFSAGHLPGQILVLSQDLVERLPSAEALAGWLVAHELIHDRRDPMLDVLHHAGTRATLAMLGSGTLPEGALDGYAAARLAQPVVWPDPAALAARLSALGIPFAPFAGSLPPEAARLAAVLAAGPDRGVPLMTDGEWLTLQGVCTD